MKYKLTILCYLFFSSFIFSQIDYEKYRNLGFELLLEEAQSISSTLVDSFGIDKSYEYPKLYKFPDGDIYLCDNNRETRINSAYLEQRKQPSDSIHNPLGVPPKVPSRSHHYNKKLIHMLNKCSIKRSHVYDEPHLHYRFANCSHSDFDLTNIIETINELGLIREVKFSDGNSYGAFHDNLYFYELENKLLVVWFDKNVLFGNFMSYDGKWQLNSPMLLLQDIDYIDKYNNSHQIIFDTLQKRSTNIFDLDIQWDEEFFYISYSVELYQRRGVRLDGGFVKTLKLDNNLKILIEKQLPETLTHENQYSFANRTRTQLLLFDEGLIHLVRVKKSIIGNEAILCEILNKDLKVVGKKTLILDSLLNYRIKIPVERVKDGFIITHCQRVNKRIIVLAQKIGFNGKVSSPYIVYDEPNNRGSISSFNTQIVKNKMLFYFQFSGWKIPSFLEIYAIKLNQIK